MKMKFSLEVKAGRRTYFFDVRETKAEIILPLLKARSTSKMVVRLHLRSTKFTFTKRISRISLKCLMKHQNLSLVKRRGCNL